MSSIELRRMSFAVTSTWSRQSQLYTSLACLVNPVLEQFDIMDCVIWKGGHRELLFSFVGIVSAAFEIYNFSRTEPFFEPVQSSGKCPEPNPKSGLGAQFS